MSKLTRFEALTGSGALVGAAFGLGGFAHDARQEEVAGVFEILHQFNIAIARADDAQAHGDLSVLYGRFKRCDLDAGGQNSLQIFHGQRPREGLLVEELIETFGLLEGAGIVGLLHHGLVAAGAPGVICAIFPSSE